MKGRVGVIASPRVGQAGAHSGSCEAIHPAVRRLARRSIERAGALQKATTWPRRGCDRPVEQPRRPVEARISTSRGARPRDRDAYLEQAVFARRRSFSRDEFRAFMFARSMPHPDAIAVLDELARSRRYLIAALNNESVELNQYRIDRFELRRP